MPAPLQPLVQAWRRPVLPPIPGRVAVPTAGRAFLLAGLGASASGPILALVPGEREAEDLFDDVALFTDGVLLLPAWETLPFEHVSPNGQTMARRAEARWALRSAMAGTIVIASARAASQRVSPSAVAPITAAVGESLDFDRFVEDLSSVGYERTVRVESRGEFAVRGGIVDVFPAQNGEPVRLDFFGDTVESIRTVEVSSQRSARGVEALVAFPPREVRPDDAMASVASRSFEAWASDTSERIAQ